jgi:hypothetical protein
MRIMARRVRQACRLAACLAVLTFDAWATEKRCDRVSIDSVDGIVSIRHEKILGIATTHNRGGVAIWVHIKPPDRPPGASQIRRMRLWADARPSIQAVCKKGPDIGMQLGINCVKSVPGKGLQLLVTFEPENARDQEAQTDALVTYVLEDVLDCPDPSRGI